MKVLVIGGSGFVGRRLLARLAASGRFSAASLSRHPPEGDAGRSAAAGWRSIRGDCRDRELLRTVLRDVDVVVNCVMGDHGSIADGAARLAEAAASRRDLRIVHLSSMAVYGERTGLVRESDAPGDAPCEGLNWYARAKVTAEAAMQRRAAAGAPVVILRPGCVYGPGSPLWVGRIARWLHAGRLGDLGAAGDGWSNLVHVEDVVDAAVAALDLPVREGEGAAVCNLAAPDSPRWNRYFVELALAIGVRPVPRITAARLRTETLLYAPPLKLAERALERAGARWPSLRAWHDLLPQAMPPSLLRLFSRQIRLDASASERLDGLSWTPFERGLAESAGWFLHEEGVLAPGVVHERGARR